MWIAYVFVAELSLSMSCLPRRRVSKKYVRFTFGAKIASKPTSHFSIPQKRKTKAGKTLCDTLLTSKDLQFIHVFIHLSLFTTCEISVFKIFYTFLLLSRGLVTGWINFTPPYNLFIHPRVRTPIPQNRCQNVEPITLKLMITKSRDLEYRGGGISRIRNILIYFSFMVPCITYQY